MKKRARVLAYGSAALLVVLGVAAGIIFAGILGQLLAIVLIGLGCVAAVALVFYEVGLSEDRERAREEAETIRAKRPTPARRRSGLQRLRGERRRLD
jgi:hypothetical protein